MRASEILLELSPNTRKAESERFRKQDPSLTDSDLDKIFNSWEQYSSSFDANERDITKFSLQQVRQMIDDAEVRVRIKGKQNVPASYDPQDVVYRDDSIGLLILKGNTEDKCIRYGRGFSWCISARNFKNMFDTYRFSDDSTFYFIFDSELDDHNPWRAIVLYVNNYNEFRVADAHNNDRRMQWDDIIAKQPKIANLKSLFKSDPLTDEEKSMLQFLFSGSDPSVYDGFSLRGKYQYIKAFQRLSPEQQQLTPPELLGPYSLIEPDQLTFQSYQRLAPNYRVKFEQQFRDLITRPYYIIKYFINGFPISKGAVLWSLREKPALIRYLHENGFEITEEYQLAAVSKDGTGIRYIEEVGIEPSLRVLNASARAYHRQRMQRR